MILDSTARCLGRTLAASMLLASAAGAGLPPEDRCPSFSGLHRGGAETDAVPALLREGMVIDETGLLSLRALLPEEVWRNRDAFFHEGMRMEIGPCHRRYPVPEFFAEATEAFAGRASLDRDGNLHGHRAGLPFPPEATDPGDPANGARWAWNLERRWRGAGFAGEFRLVDMPSRIGGVQTYRGTFFFIQTGHRADLRESDYALTESDGTLWIAGGRFDEPFAARHLAWRQLRPTKAQLRYSQPDDIFVYVPTMRKMRRAAAPWVDGFYTPRYRVSGDSGGGAMPIGGGEFGPTGAIQPTAGESIAVTENLRRGFTGLALRPNAYVWRVLGEREVLAPLNATRTGYPTDAERNFGPSGLSVGSDRWDVRYAVVIQGAARTRGGEFDTLTLYVDYQTQQPLYVITKRGRGRLVDVGILVHRFSGDVAGYPPWPDGEKAQVFDPVAAVFHAADGSGWRRESYEIRSTPADPALRRRFLSPDFLIRGR